MGYYPINKVTIQRVRRENKDYFIVLVYDDVIEAYEGKLNYTPKTKEFNMLQEALNFLDKEINSLAM